MVGDLYTECSLYIQMDSGPELCATLFSLANTQKMRCFFEFLQLIFITFFLKNVSMQIGPLVIPHNEQGVMTFR